MYRDRYDLEVSCASEAALAAYSAGIDCVLELDEPGIAELTEATRQDKEFALAHAVLSRQLLIHGFTQEAAEHLRAAVSCKDHATRREQSVVAVVEATASFNPSALAMAINHVEQYPLDVFVLAYIVGPFGLLAFSGQRDWRKQNVALLQETQATYPADDWWHMTTRAFMAAEVGELNQARRDGERAWALRENGNCAHTLVHMQFEIGALKESASFINSWDSQYGGSSGMRHHLIWHLALLHREAGVDDALQLYARYLDPDVSDPMPLTTFSDNASLLWRCALSGAGIPADYCLDLMRYADSHYPDSGFAFADIHRVMAVALLGDRDRQQALAEELAGLAEKTGTELARCMVEFALGFNAFAAADYIAAATILEPVNAHSVLLGGSNPQRNIIMETFLEARKRANRV